MTVEELKKSFVGKYFIDKYNLDSENSYIRVLHIYRVNRVELLAPYVQKLICTKMSICYEDKKKTSERCIIEAKISDVEVDSRIDPDTSNLNNILTSMVRVGKKVWDDVAKELINVITQNSGLMVNMQQYCDICENNETENCRFCCKKGEEEPTQFKEKQ